MQINANIRLEVAGENALILYFYSNEQLNKTDIQNSPEISANVYQAKQLIEQYLNDDIVDLIPSYASILVVFNLLETDHHQLANKLNDTLKDCLGNTTNKGKLIELPVYYSLESGVDLPNIAKKANLSIEQVISLHSDVEYHVYAIGFAPGFAYLGEVDERIAMPRLTTPRTKVPKGAVAIADRQTAVYPAQSPGGWHLLGLCPLEMFTPNGKPIMPVEVGDRVKFVAINKSTFIALGGVIPISPI